jgi:DNA-binding XRE family transcriptional regulator
MTADEVITDYQKKYGLNDANLARLIGVNPSTICRIKKGEQQPSNKTWNLIWARTPELHQKLQDFYHGEQKDVAT